MSNNKKNTKVCFSREEILKIAHLANLSLTEEEIVRFQKQLSETLNYIEILNELKTDGITPTSQVTGLKNVARDDETKPSLTQEQALSGANFKFNGCFKVKAVIEK